MPYGCAMVEGHRVLFYLLCLTAGGGAKRFRGIDVTIKPTVQLLCRCGKVFQSHLFPWDAAATLRVHTVPAALLVT